MPTTKDFLQRKFRDNHIDEYLADELRNAEYGGCEIRRTPLGDRVVLRAGRVGLAIGARGKTVRRITDVLRTKFGLDNPQVEVLEVPEPELDARIMAFRLASSLERGRHFRRSAHGIMRRIIGSGAKGVEIIISGKITSQRARVETFRAGFVAKCGYPASKYVDEGQATALIRRGLIGVKVRLMQPDAELPDDIEILAEPTADGLELFTDDELLEGEDEEETEEELSEEDELYGETMEELEEYPDIEMDEEEAEEEEIIEDEFDELDEIDEEESETEESETEESETEE